MCDYHLWSNNTHSAQLLDKKCAQPNTAYKYNLYIACIQEMTPQVHNGEPQAQY